MTAADEIRSYTSGVLRARATYTAERAYDKGLCVCGRRLESNARTCRPCRRAKTQENAR